MRVVIVEDNALLREGVVAPLRERDIDVVAQAEDGLAAAHHRGTQAGSRDRRRAPCAELLRRGTARRHRGAPPPTRSRCSSSPSTWSPCTPPSCWPRARAASATCSRSGAGTSAQPRRARARRGGRHGAGPRGRRPARGHPPRRRGRRRAGDAHSREREVLELMVEGRTNAAIARKMVVRPGAVEKHISSIFSKLDSPGQRRRPPARAGGSDVPAGRDSPRPDPVARRPREAPERRPSPHDRFPLAPPARCCASRG